jgi:hypothetical protein
VSLISQRSAILADRPFLRPFVIAGQERIAGVKQLDETPNRLLDASQKNIFVRPNASHTPLSFFREISFSDMDESLFKLDDNGLFEGPRTDDTIVRPDYAKGIFENDSSVIESCPGIIE